MTSHSMRNKAPLVLPPEKGSFPLDRESVCADKGSVYRKCLLEHDNSSTICRQKARDYFECRMDNGLMKREPWEKLGLGDDQLESSDTKKGTTKEKSGWVAGKRRER